MNDTKTKKSRPINVHQYIIVVIPLISQESRNPSHLSSEGVTLHLPCIFQPLQ